MHPSPASRTDFPREDYARSNWLNFAGTMFILIGCFNILDGLIALFKDDYYVVSKDGLVFLNYTAWGWFWIIFGIVLLLVGYGVYAGRMWARIVGVGLAALNAIAQLAFIAAFPLWTVIMIALDVLVIYALTAHGSEVYE